MKDYPIGHVFLHPKFGSLKVVAREDGCCDGCVFNGEGNTCYNDADCRHTGECAAQDRIDHTDVIFVENRVSDVERDNCTDNRFEVIAAAKKPYWSVQTSSLPTLKWRCSTIFSCVAGRWAG